MSLNLSGNEIVEIDEVCTLNRLPMLQSLDLTENPITAEPDYRSQILGRIPNRINDIVVSALSKFLKFSYMFLIFCFLKNSESIV